jgi:uncharacterized protein (DUF2235 family)
MKNIVICLDGTGNAFGDANSNVVKLYGVLDLTSPFQIAYYHPGLGTMGAPNALSAVTKWWTRQLGLAFGYGITRNIANAYTFLMENYEPDDRVFLFGFSRGAYTARALAGMLHMVGLIRAGDHELIAYAARFLKKPEKTTWALAKAFAETFARPCKLHFVGVWDTVSSVGWLYDPVKYPYTAKNPSMKIGRHAISIDERRCCFRQNLWGTPAADQDIRQVWFAGVHSDVGGSYPEAESGLSKVALEWMIEEAVQAGLLVDATKIARTLGRAPGSFVPPDPDAKIHNSLRSFWLLLELFPRRFYDNSVTPPVWRWRVPLAERRRMPEEALIHNSVLVRRSRVHYEPSNLPKRWTVEA